MSSHGSAVSNLNNLQKLFLFRVQRSSSKVTFVPQPRVSNRRVKVMRRHSMPTHHPLGKNYGVQGTRTFGSTAVALGSALTANLQGIVRKFVVPILGSANKVLCLSPNDKEYV